MGRWTVALGISIALCGCPDEDDRLPCPPRGIGVEPLQTDIGGGPGECTGGLTCQPQTTQAACHK